MAGMRSAICLGAALLAAGCGKAPTAAPQQPAAAQPAPLEHDFGVIPHGETRQFDFALDTASLGPGVVPLHVQLDCSCGRGELILRGRDGSERTLDGRPVLDNAPRDGESVFARVTIDTRDREAVDLAKTTSHGYVVLQPADDRTGSRRVRWPLLLRFGVDAPVVLQPFAELDFGRVPVCRAAALVTALRGDEHHSGVHFGRVVASDPQILPSLEPDDAGVVLRVRCQPGELGNHRAIVSVETDLPNDYVVHLPVTWKVVPALEATPMPKVSFRTDLGRGQSEDEAYGQFVLVTDHDESRAAAFVVREVTDGAGRDAAANFAITFEPVPGQPRQFRMHVRYLGGHAEGFRGRIVLGKPDPDPARLAIELVVFPTR